jgi:hypothetical protein
MADYYKPGWQRFSREGAGAEPFSTSGNFRTT